LRDMNTGKLAREKHITHSKWTRDRTKPESQTRQNIGKQQNESKAMAKARGKLMITLRQKRISLCDRRDVVDLRCGRARAWG
jgi:hypothetical protein